MSGISTVPGTGFAGAGNTCHRSPCSIHRWLSRAWRLLACWLLACTAPVVADPVECKPDGTAVERAYCAAVAQRDAELALIAVVERARTAFAADADAAAAFERANRAWTDYVEATIATAFPCPFDDLTLCYTEETPRCVALLRTRLAEERRALIEALLAQPGGSECCE